MSLMLNDRLGITLLEACTRITLAKIDIFPTNQETRRLQHVAKWFPTTRKFQMANRFVNLALTAGLMLVLSNDAVRILGLLFHQVGR